MFKHKIGPLVTVNDRNLGQVADGLLTLDGSGNGAFDIGMPTCGLVGIRVILAAGTVSVPFTLANMGRTILGATASASTWYNTGELITNSDGTTTLKFFDSDAPVHGDITFTVTGGTANGKVSVLFVYEI